MEYESDRALNDPQLEEAKRKAFTDFETYFDLKGEVPDPNWAQPAPQPQLPGVPVDQAQGFWINGGKTGSKKDEPSASETFDHDLPALEKNGPKELPAIPNTPAGKLTAADTDKLIKARTDPTDEDLAKMLNATVLDMYKRMEGGLYSKENLIKAYKGFHSA
jgi:hypothetical protein